MDFEEACSRIKKAYEKVSPKLGYRFLYSSKKTFKADIPLLLLATNPGGGKREKPSLSAEDGNAYHKENWGKRGGKSTLQRQIEALFELVKRKRGESAKGLMDRTLSANFCFFRSRSWKQLDKEGSLDFCREFWKDALKFLRPRTIIAIGQVPYWEARQVLIDDGYEVAPEDTFPTNWGEILIRTSVLKKAKRRVVIVGLPHLSRFAIFGRKTGDEFFDPVLELMDR